MAGGLFGRPFAFNIKRIIFSLICMSLFLYKPSFSNNYTLYGALFIIFVISYVAMAWYDYFYECRILPLRQGKYSWMRLIKPVAHEPEKQKEGKCDEDKTARHILIYMMHLLFIAPLIAYIAIYKTKINPMVYPLLGVLAVFTAGYHGIALMVGSH